MGWSTRLGPATVEGRRASDRRRWNDGGGGSGSGCYCKGEVVGDGSKWEWDCCRFTWNAD